ARRQQNSGESSREKAKVRVHHTLTVIAREGGRSSIPETIVIEPISRGVLDSPPARGMTASLGIASAVARNDGA
ncbi:hypothetical protein, partial [Bradyrhizobium sp. AT1]|uniref:hypothetical protein n=1 Tax=Bradyrhizobium sp. AT1 TaxID=574934 RepID=UPI001AEC852B